MPLQFTGQRLKCRFDRPLWRDVGGPEERLRGVIDEPSSRLRVGRSYLVDYYDLSLEFGIERPHRSGAAEARTHDNAGGGVL